jgi:hypothetical protein
MSAYRCQFLNTKTDQRLSVTAQLTDAEIKSVERLRAGNGDADLYAQACALRHAYREAGKGFQHIEPPTAVRPS